MRNPTRPDKKPGSFTYHLTKNIWKDWATGDGGSNFISLVSYLQGSSFADAKDWTVNLLGGTTAAASFKARPVVPVVKNRQIVLPVPLDAAMTVTGHKCWGRPTYSWTYRDQYGRVLMLRNRYDYSDGTKRFCPFTLWESRRGQMIFTAWYPEDIPGRRPLYRLDLLASIVRTMNFIGSSNKQVSSMVLDTTGARRFYELSTADTIDHAVINSIDSANAEKT